MARVDLQTAEELLRKHVGIKDADAQLPVLPVLHIDASNRNTNASALGHVDVEVEHRVLIERHGHV